MAYTAANFAQISSVNGYAIYRYDTTDLSDTVETAGYFNNKDDDLNLAKGDLIHAVSWTTAVRTGTISQYRLFVVTNVVPNNAAASAGAVNVAEVGISSAGAISSGQ